MPCVAGADHRLRPVQPARRSSAIVGLRRSSASTGSRACSGSSARPTSSSSSFVWMRGTLPRVRIDQLMGFAWKWLLPASLLNLFVTAAAIVVVGPNVRPPPMMRLPGLGIVKGMALTLRRFFEPKVTIKYPEVRLDVPHEVPRPAPAALRRVRHAQVRDVLPVRPGLPDRVHRHGRHRHEGPLPRPLGRARDVRRAARGVGPAAVRPAGPGRGLRPLRRRSTPGRSTRSSSDFDHDPKRMLQILEATQAAYGHLPVAALKRISQRPAPGTR